MFANLLAAAAEKRVVPIKSHYEVEMKLLWTRRLKQIGTQQNRVVLVENPEITRRRAYYCVSLGLPSLLNSFLAFPVDPAVELPNVRPSNVNDDVLEKDWVARSRFS
jgi:hypothetical protein